MPSFPRDPRRASALAAIVLLCFSCASGPPESPKPYNVVFFLVDDMGYADAGAYGNTYHRTPNIDRLASEGMRFTHAYAAAPNCSPTRGSILTGKWPARVGITQYLYGNFLPHAKLLQTQLPAGLALDETVIAEPLRAAGYRTAAIGKWHLGGGKYLPENQGFEVTFGRTRSGAQGSHRAMFAPHPYLDIPGAKKGDYITDRLAREAEQFLEASHEQPFFLYLPFYAVHAPIQAKQEVIDTYASRTDPTGRNNQTYAAMVEGMDQAVGRVLAKLEQLNISDRTVVFFFSDNGGVESRAFNGGLRRGKGWVYEGGIREPLIVKWPGVVQPGSINHTPVSSIDFYPSILDITGVADAPGHQSDGISLTPLLRQSGGWERDTLYWHYPHYSNAGSAPMGAIRQGNDKLIEHFEDGGIELFDLEKDPNETTDLSAELPAKARDLQGKLAEWRRSIGARMPQPNPNYDPARAKEKGPAPQPAASG